jgi:hypothetical protein
VHHIVIPSLEKSFGFVQKHDEIDITWGVTHTGQACRRFGLVLDTVVDEMCHGFSKHSLLWISLAGYMFEFAIEFLVGQILYEFHGPRFLVCPTCPKPFEGGKLLRFPTGILQDCLPALTPDPLTK